MNKSISNGFFNIQEMLGSWLITSFSNIAVVILPFVFLFIFFKMRTGTSYGLLNRLYTIFIGGSDFHHDPVIKFWHERKDVERFNALFNMKAKSLKEIQLFVDWIEKYDLDLEKFTRLRGWFDFEKRTVEKINAWWIAVPCAFALLAYFTLFPTMVVASVDAALIRFKSEEQWIFLDHTQARNFSINPLRNKVNDWQISKVDCSNSSFSTEKTAKKNQLLEENVRIICESFNNLEDAQWIENTINSQKFFWFVVVALGLISRYCFVQAVRMGNTYNSRRYLRGKIKSTRLGRSPSALSIPASQIITDSSNTI